MSMSYKDDLNRLVEYLNKEKDSLVNDELWDKSSEALYEELEEYRRAIFGALDTIKYYEEREAILKAQHGSEFMGKLDADWFALRKAFIAEHTGIGFERQEVHNSEQEMHESEQKMHDPERKMHDPEQKMHDPEQKMHDPEQKEDDGHEVSD